MGSLEDSHNANGQLLSDIKEVSKALYLTNVPQKPLLSLPHSLSKLDKKKKAWDWKKPLKVIAHLGQRRFNVCFHLHVHSIEGLPSNLDNTKLVVQWKKKKDEVVIMSTQPCNVTEGKAEFEETLMHRCLVYGSKHGPHRSAKYEMKLLLVSVSPVDAPWIVLGKHWIDLTRILPLSLEELEDVRSTRKWNTSFKISDSAVLNVSFDYSIVGTNSVSGNVMLRRVGSVPSMSNKTSSLVNDVSLDLSKSIDFLYDKLSQKSSTEETDKQADEGTEVEIIDVHEILKDEDEEELSVAMDDSTEKAKSSSKATKVSTKSLSLDDISESVANDFLNMLELEECTSEGEPTSPREHLLREFEKEVSAFGNCFLGSDGEAEHVSDIDGESNDFSFSSSSLCAGENKGEGKSLLLIKRRKAKVLENLETETLEKSLCDVSSDGFGSPIELPVDKGSDLLPLKDSNGTVMTTDEVPL